LATFLVVHPYLDIYGGGERVCHNVIKTLLVNDQKVELLTFNFDADKYRDIVGEDLSKEVAIHSLGKRIEVKPPFTIYKRHRNFVNLLKQYKNKLDYDFLFSTQSSSPFEPVFLSKAKKNIAYVHFPEIHYDYANGRLRRKIYLWLFKRWVEQGIGKLDLILCNSNYTKGAIERYWKNRYVRDPVVVYPPVNLSKFWCDKPMSKRKKQIVYIARFIPAKRHEIMKSLASDIHDCEFISIGGLIDAEKAWFDTFNKNLPPNYSLKTNLPENQLIEILQNSRIYVHLMEGEHFGIAPVEGLASGCITFVHDSGGMQEFIPEEFRWKSYFDLKEKIVNLINIVDKDSYWEKKRESLWRDISVLTPENFQNNIWSLIQTFS